MIAGARLGQNIGRVFILMRETPARGGSACSWVERALTGV